MFVSFVPFLYISVTVSLIKISYIYNSSLNILISTLYNFMVIKRIIIVEESKFNNVLTSGVVKFKDTNNCIKPLP